MNLTLPWILLIVIAAFLTIAAAWEDNKSD